VNTSTVASLLASRASGLVETNFPLKRLTTYRLGGPASVYFEPSSGEDIVAFGDVMRALEGEQAPPVLVMGRGSNLVVSDEGWPGVVMRLGAAFSWIEPIDDPATGLVAGAATPMPLLANWAARRGLAGIEFAIAIPGSVGGAVRMNAGAHGRETASALESARLLDLDSLAVEEMKPSDLDYSYRHSNVTDGQVVLDARFQLSPEEPASVRNRMEEYRRHRAATQPGAVQNAGSVFKNPPGDHAGRLVEAAGLKGFAVGRASVSELHANFFIAQDGARAQDVYDLVHAVRARVREGFGVDLTPEIRFVGPFDDDQEEAP
jgi:UDP-N-acetylmuramate dehydrogenase